MYIRMSEWMWMLGQTPGTSGARVETRVFPLIKEEAVFNPTLVCTHQLEQINTCGVFGIRRTGLAQE